MLSFIELETIDEPQHSIAGHDLGQARYLSPLALHPSEEHLLSETVIDYPRLCAHKGDRNVEEELGELDVTHLLVIVV